MTQEELIKIEYYKSIFLDTFKDLTFEENTHSYFLKLGNGKKLKYSVSGLISKIKNPFPLQEKAQKQAKELGTSVEEVLQRWESKKVNACDKGNKVHLFGEKYMFDRSIKPSNKQEEAVVKFWESLPNFVIPVFSELQMYCKKYLFAGTADIILFNTMSKTFIIADYKTNESLFTCYGNQKLLKEFSHLQQTNYNAYQIQLSYYQYLFEQTGLSVSSRKLIWLKDDGNFELYDTQDLKPQIITYLKNNYAA